MTFSDWIDSVTPQVINSTCGYREGTVRMWKNRNSIPRGVWPDLMTSGLTCLRELLEMESNSK